MTVLPAARSGRVPRSRWRRAQARFRRCLPGLGAVILVLSAAAAAAAEEPAPDAGRASLYAVNAAALSAAMTWCEARHGVLQTGSPGASCFSAARGVLAGFGLRQWADDIGARCSDPATLNTCLTPEIARLVRALNSEFRSREL